MSESVQEQRWRPILRIVAESVAAAIAGLAGPLLQGHVVRSCVAEVCGGVITRTVNLNATVKLKSVVVDVVYFQTSHSRPRPCSAPHRRAPGVRCLEHGASSCTLPEPTRIAFARNNLNMIMIEGGPRKSFSREKFSKWGTNCRLRAPRGRRLGRAL